MAKSNSPYMELGTTGLRRFGGYIYEEFMPELSGHKAYKVYREMSNNDPIVGSILFAIKQLIRQVEWRVDPFSTDKDDVEKAEFVDSCRDDMSCSWHDFLNDVLTMLPYGFAPHEIVYKRRLGPGKDPTKRSKHNDGLIGWRKLPLRSQDTVWQWTFDEDGSVNTLVQIAPPDYHRIEIPIEKLLIFRPETSKNNPEGRSILRNAYRPWYFKQRIENIEGIGIERDLAGLPVAMIPPELLASTASNEEKALLNEIKKIVTNIRRDEQEGLVLPMAYDENGKPLYEFKLLNSGGTRQIDTDKIVNRYDQRIAMTALADFILLGHEKVGSFALSSSKTDLFATALATWLGAITSVFNRIAIPRLFEMNGWPLDKLPQLNHSDIESVDLTQLGTFLQTLSSMGMPLFPDTVLENFLRKQAGLPEVAEGDAQRDALTQEDRFTSDNVSDEDLGADDVDETTEDEPEDDEVTQ